MCSLGNCHILHGDACHNAGLDRYVDGGRRAHIDNGQRILAVRRPGNLILVVFKADSAAVIKFNGFGSAVLVGNLQDYIPHSLLGVIIKVSLAFIDPMTPVFIKFCKLVAIALDHPDAFHRVFHHCCRCGGVCASVPNLKFVFAYCPILLVLVGVNTDAGVFLLFIVVGYFLGGSVFIGDLQLYGIAYLLNGVAEKFLVQFQVLIIVLPIAICCVILHKFGDIRRKQFDPGYRGGCHCGVGQHLQALVGDVVVIVRAHFPGIVIEIPLIRDAAADFILCGDLFAGAILIVDLQDHFP